MRPPVGVHLFDHLCEYRIRLVGSHHVVQEDELRRVGDVDRAVRFVERVLTGREHRQRRAIRAELRSHGFACDEGRVRSQTRIQVLLNGISDNDRCHELAGGQPHEATTCRTIVVAVPIVVAFLPVVAAFLQRGVR